MALTAEQDVLQRACFGYFDRLADGQTGLVPDTSLNGAPASVAVTGMGLTVLCVASERGWIPRREAARRTLTTLRFFNEAAPSKDGFFFHFLHAATGTRAWKCEVSTIDSGLLFLGALCAAAYFEGTDAVETQIRELSEGLFRRANWHAFADREERLKLAWKPESGFSAQAWGGYNESLLLMVLVQGAELHGLSPRAYETWCRGSSLKRTYGYDWLYCGPLFTHLFPHMWLKLQGRTDASTRALGLDYWDSTKAAIRVQHEYANRNPRGRVGYGGGAWGLSACDGPGRSSRRSTATGHFGYRARGAPFGPDDGTLSPPVAVASAPFEPELAREALKYWLDHAPHLFGEIGLRGAINPELHWSCAPFFGLDQGMICILLENARSGLIWEIMERSAVIRTGMRRAGFSSD